MTIRFATVDETHDLVLCKLRGGNLVAITSDTCAKLLQILAADPAVDLTRGVLTVSIEWAERQQEQWVPK